MYFTLYYLNVCVMVIQKCIIICTIVCVLLQIQSTAMGPSIGFVPYVDGVVVPDHPVTLRTEGKFHKVPIIMGLNEQESNYLLPYCKSKSNTFQNRLDSFFFRRAL